MNNLDKNKRYIVACSFGPDSMALLNMLISKNYDVVVAHVNYHKRKESNFEEESLKKYCSEHDVKCEVLDTTGMKCEKNFQEWARDIRYKFFGELVKKYKAEAVLVAHQQDDLLETYLMQKKRGGFYKNLGIAEKTTIFGVNIIRPLLKFSKQELLDYDQKNNVPFSIDISNLSDVYERNKIRHSVVEKLSKEERSELLAEITNQNESVGSFSDTYSVDEFISMNDKELTFLISSFLERNDEHVDLSKSFLNEIRIAMQSKKPNVRIPLNENVSINKEYLTVVLFDKRSQISYSYLLDKNTKIDDDLFEIDFSKGAKDRNVKESDYPLTIKQVDKNDTIEIKNYECVVRRLFIDWKVPHSLRFCWPGIYNHEGKLIYVPRYRDKFVDNHISKFIIRFTKLDQN